MSSRVLVPFMIAQMVCMTWSNRRLYVHRSAIAPPLTAFTNCAVQNAGLYTTRVSKQTPFELQHFIDICIEVNMILRTEPIFCLGFESGLLPRGCVHARSKRWAPVRQMARRVAPQQQRVGSARRVGRSQRKPLKRRVASASGDTAADEGGEPGDVPVEVVGVLQATDGLSGQVLLVRKGSSLRSGSPQLAEAPSEERILPIAVGGDAFYSIRALLEGWSPVRPLALHLLSQLIQAFGPSTPSSESSGTEAGASEPDTQLSSSDDSAFEAARLHLQRLRIHSLQRQTFLGEITISLSRSQPDLGAQHVTLDCRPSDGMFLAYKLKKPIFVSSSVWDDASRPAADILPPAEGSEGSRRMQDAGSASRAWYRARGSVGEEATASEDVDPRYDIVGNDPDRIKWLKRQLSVALNEEDYEKAAELRDNKFFAKYLEAIKAGENGRADMKRQLLAELKHEIDEEERQESESASTASSRAESSSSSSGSGEGPGEQASGSNTYSDTSFSESSSSPHSEGSGEGDERRSE